MVMRLLRMVMRQLSMGMIDWRHRFGSGPFTQTTIVKTRTGTGVQRGSTAHIWQREGGSSIAAIRRA